MTQKTSVPKTLIPGCTKLASLSVTVAMALGLLFCIPKQVGGQTQPTPSAQQSAELQEAERLNQQVEQLYKEGKYKQAIPIAERVLAIREKVLGNEHLDIATSLNNLAELYRNMGSYDRAEPLYQQALAIYEKVLGSQHPSTATSLNNLAELYQDMGSYDKAEPLYQRALAIYEKVLGKEHPDTATSLNNLAELYQDMGSYDKAEPLYQRALAIYEKVLGKEHPDTATSLNNLALLYQDMGSYDKAEPLYQRALAIYEKVLGKEHPDTAISMNNLAGLYRDMGSYYKAEPLLKRALAIFEKVLGSQHPSTATSLNNLAGLYRDMGSYYKAEPFLKRALAIFEKVLGSQHPSTASSLNNLAELYRNMGSYDKAEPLYQRALAIREKVLGYQHPSTATSLNNLALLYKHMGSYDKAEPLYQRALAITEKVLGSQHPDTAISMNNLAGLYRDMGSYYKAEPLLKRALAIFEKVLGSQHPSTATSLNNLALLYSDMGSYDKAELLYQRALAITEKVLGYQHPSTATSLNNLAELYRDMGSYDKAEPLYQRALAITEKVLGYQHPSTAQSLNNLALLYKHMGSYDKAEPLFKRSLAIKEKLLTPQHPSTVTSLNNLSALYLAKGDITRATDFFSRGLEIQEQNLKLIFSGISEQRKQDFTRTFAGTTNNIVSLSLKEARNNPKAAQLALTTVLRRKGRVLDAVTDSTQILRSQLKNNPQAEQLFNQWLDMQQQLSALVYKELGEQTPEQYKTRYEQLEARREELEAAISAKSAEFRTEIEPVELAAVQAKIPEDAALVEIVQYRPYNPKANKRDKPRYAAAILRNQGQPKWVDLGEAATINQSVSELRKALSSPPSKPNRSIKVEPADGKSVEELARKLDEQVMKPIRSHLGNARHLLVSPEGQLTLIPFEALRDDKGKYLVENYAFSYLTSGRDLLRFDATANNNSAPVVFADIDYDEQQTTVAINTRGSENRRSTDLASMTVLPLDATLEEAQKIKSIFSNTKVILNKQATETALKQLQSPSILHLATHGFFLPDVEVDLSTQNVGLIANKIAKPPRRMQLENPLLRSGLTLAGFNNRNKSTNNNDGVLTALEVAGLDLKGTQLVVLSACETGLGDVKVGSGLYGLRRALVMAGSQSQVLSLWLVSDDGTKDLMVKYYQGLKAGKGRHQALRDAQLEFLSTKKYEHPYFWAAFVPSGNWAGL